MRNRISSTRCFGSLLTTLAVALCSCTASCPTRNDAPPLDLNQLSGEWFLVAGIPATGKSLSKCGRFTVSSSTPDTFAMNYTALTHLRNRPVALIFNARFEDDVIGDLQLQGSRRTLGPYKMRVLAVDYDSYFVVGICAANDSVKDFSMILSRSITLPSAILATMKNKLGSYFDRDAIVDVDQRSCWKM